MKNTDETTIGDTINSCHPNVKQGLKDLFDVFGNLENILLHQEASHRYCVLMLYVILKREEELGRVKHTDWKYEYRSFEEIKKDYGGTFVMPFC